MLANVSDAIRHRLQQIRLVLMDIDGTLVTGRDETIGNVIRQLSRLKAKGVRFSLATGRTVFGARHIARSLVRLGATMPPLIAYNGAVIAPADNVGIVQRHNIPRDVAVPLLSILDASDVRVLAYTFGVEVDTFVEHVYSPSRHAQLSSLEPNGMAIELVDSITKVDVSDLTAILVDCGDSSAALFTETSQRLIALFGTTLRITASGTRYVEIAAQGVSKLAAMRNLADIWGIGVDEILAIGDGFNDLEMIVGAGVGAAVSNAPADVRSGAGLVASRPASEGVVEILRVLLSELRDVRMQHKASLT